MKKRIISLLISVSTLMSGVAISVTAEDAVYNESYDVLNKLGLIDKDEDESITRAEFAQLVYDVKEFAQAKGADSSWSDNFFGDVEEEMEIIEDVEKTYIFDDVDPYNENSEAITALASIGVIHGVGNNTFSPELVIKNIEMIKTILDFMGYTPMCNINGGYPGGYIKTANELGITDGISTSVTAEATVRDAVQLIYNSFDVKLMKIGYGEDGMEVKTSDTDTLLTKIMQVDYVKGVMTDNGITSLYGSSDAGLDNIICNGITLSNEGENKKENRECLGYNVKAFYSIADISENQALVVIPLARNKVTEIDADDFSYFEGRKLGYFDGRNEKNITIAENAKIIYNGKAKTSFFEEDFELQNGTITLIAPTGGVVETIKIENYVSMYVSFADSEDYIIYNKAYSNLNSDNAKSLVLEEAVENETLYITDSEGNVLDFTDIAEGSVIDVCKNGDAVKIIVSKNSVKAFEIKKTGKNSNEDKFISNGDSEYILDDAYLICADYRQPQLGDIFDVFINSFGKAVWLDAASTYEMNVGYYMSVVIDEESTEADVVYMKLIDSEGTGVKYQLAKKVKFGDSTTVEEENYEKLDPLDIYARFRLIDKGIIGYNLTADKLIDKIELPLNKRGGKNRLQLVYNSNGEKVIYKPDGYGYFKDYTLTDESTKVFTTPANEADMNNSDKYDCVPRTTVFTSQGTYPVVSYTTTDVGNLAEYMILQKDVVTSLSFGSSDCVFFIVTGVTTELSPDEEPAIKLTGYKTSEYKTTNKLTEMTLYAKDDAGVDRAGNPVNPALMATDTPSLAETNHATTRYYKIRPGDIIRYKYDSEEIYPTGIELLYRADMKNPYFTNGVKGGLAGSVGIIDGSEGLKYNPYAFTGSGGTLTANVLDFNVGRRVYYGFINTIQSNISIATTQDLTVETYDPNLGGGKYAHAYIPMRGSTSKFTINYGKNSVSAKVADISDIKPYDQYFNDCSRVIAITENGYYITIFIINGEYEG